MFFHFLESRTKGISNPLCSHDMNFKQQTALTVQHKPKRDVPDLMSFSDSTSSNSKNSSEDWISLELPSVGVDTDSHYDARIQNVMSLFDSSTTTNQNQLFTQKQWQPQNVQSNPAMARRASYNSTSIPQHPQVMHGYPQINRSYPQAVNPPTTFFPQRTMPAMSQRSSFSYSTLQSSTKEPIAKTNSHPNELNLFGQGRPTTMPSGFSSELMTRKGSWKSFEEDNDVLNNVVRAHMSSFEETKSASFQSG